MGSLLNLVLPEPGFARLLFGKCGFLGNINLFGRSRDSSAPMVAVDWVFLIQVDLEELVMNETSEVLVPGLFWLLVTALGAHSKLTS
jgi:hypothetical protein